MAAAIARQRQHEPAAGVFVQRICRDELLPESGGGGVFTAVVMMSGKCPQRLFA